MELTHLKYFHAVAKLGSFTKASKALRVSQPSISKTIKQIEERQGVRLLDRTRRGGVSLTEIGRIYFHSCEEIFQELQNLKTAVELRSEECFGELSIGASDNLCNYVFPELFESFCLAHPKVRIKLFNGSSTDIKADLLAGKLEVGVFHTPVYEGGLKSEKLAFVEFVIVCSPKNRALRKKGLDPNVLASEPFVSCRVSDYAKPYPIQKMLHSIGVQPNVFFETNSQETQKRMAAHNIGYAILPKYMVREYVERGLLHVVTAPKTIGAEIFLVTREGKTLSKAAQTFAHDLKALLNIKHPHTRA